MYKNNAYKTTSVLLISIILLIFLTACLDNIGLSTSQVETAQKLGLNVSEKKGDTEIVTIWDWDANFGVVMGPEFNKIYPNIKLQYVNINHDDYMQKLLASLASDGSMPDILMGETAWRGKLFDLNILENLEAVPYNFNRKELFDFQIPQLTNLKGEIVGVDQVLCPAGFAYRRDLAKKYLGTDDSDKLTEMLSDWDSFIAKGKEVKAKSNGKVWMMASLGDAFLAIQGQNAQSYIKGKVMNVTKRMKSMLEIGLKARDAGIIGKSELYTPDWQNSYAKGETIFFNCASWTPRWDIQVVDSKDKGNWGLMKATGGGFTYGGTSVGIYIGSKNKSAAWKYIKWTFLSKDGAKLDYEKRGDLPGFKSFYKGDSLINKPGLSDEFFGGENLAKYFIDKILPKIKSEPQSGYNDILNQALSKLTPLFMLDKSINASYALEKLISEVRLYAPDAKVK